MTFQVRPPSVVEEIVPCGLHPNAGQEIQPVPRTPLVGLRNATEFGTSAARPGGAACATGAAASTTSNRAPTDAPATLGLPVAVTPEVIPENTIPVLDHGFVRLDDAMASDLSVVNGARVSFARRKEVMDESDEGLIRFLMRDRHGTPF
jgi:hypothetical protein